MADDKTDRSELMADLDAFAPVPVPFKFKGTEYHVKAFLDMTYADTMELLRLEELQKASKDWGEQTRLLLAQCKLMAIDIPDDVLTTMSRRQLVQIGFVSMEMTLRPLAEAVQAVEQKSSDSPSLSPESRASTGGRTAQ